MFHKREFAHIDESIAAFFTMKAPTIPPRRWAEICAFEKPLGEEIFDIQSMGEVYQAYFYSQYFNSKEGQNDFIKTLNLTLESDIAKVSKLTTSDLLHYFKDILQNDPVNAYNLAGRSSIFAQRKIKNAILANIQNQDQFSKDIEVPERIGFLLQPALLREKLTRLHTLKNTLHQKYPSNASLPRQEHVLLETAKRRILELIARQQQYVSLLKSDSKDKVGSPSQIYSKDELWLHNYNNHREKHLSNYDQYIFGASDDLDQDGNRATISSHLRSYAEKVAKHNKSNFKKRNYQLQLKSLDKQKVFDRTFKPLQIKDICETFLKKFALQHPDIDISQWQVKIGDQDALEVLENMHQIIIPRKNQSIYHIMCITLGHEMGGHFTQAINKQRSNLSVLRARGPRSELYAEAGAMYNQNIISTELFGFPLEASPHYVRAMIKRASGAKYIDVVETFFYSMCEIESIDVNDTQTVYDYAAVTGTLSHAINRSLRIFRGAKSLGYDNKITNSKDTLYLESRRVMKNLEENEIERYAFVSGLNIDTVIKFVHAGLLKKSSILAPPNQIIREIWEELQGDYHL